ncbi:hypothetical protein SAMN05216360_110254 [Methylobacterium phyllostachyos]|uniref:Uncharacterized protein n=1 Tax=Methylobacterium phyllostachyos TaxID=582672 RepID=A0A1H0DQN2_9HYPH|nr:hypothetical protein SAMN05216360_110254 [Methylobacterium phyllostachyos]
MARRSGDALSLRSDARVRRTGIRLDGERTGSIRALNQQLGLGGFPHGPLPIELAPARHRRLALFGLLIVAIYDFDIVLGHINTDF